MRVTLADISKMNVTGPGGEIYAGGSQEWYTDRWHKLAGCGPTAAANLIWYMNRPTSEDSSGGGDIGDYLRLQLEMFGFVTPGMQGVNTPGIFTDGLSGYGLKHELDIAARVLEIPKKPRKRPETADVRGFLSAALSSDSPVAFLNLSNGTLQNLENWHWVTVTAVDCLDGNDELAASVCDQGKAFEIDFGEWLKTSALGGALVCLKIQLNAAQPPV